MKVQIIYTVPVYITVDTETQTVEAVRVDDSDMTFTNNAVTLEGSLIPDSDPVIGVAYHIAEKVDNVWPAWQFGFDIAG